MNKQTETLRLALEALENAWLDASMGKGDVARHTEAITAIREALAERCVCGEPDTPGTHRTDGPCLAEQPEQQRPQNCGTGYCSCIECPYEQPASKPVAMRYDFDGYGYKYIDAGSGSDWQTRIKDAEPVYASPQPAQQQEPVAWYDPEVMNEDRGISWTPGQFHTAPLYTSPQQRKPLTDEEIETIWQNTSPYYDHQDFARDIEAAHGIKEKA